MTATLKQRYSQLCSEFNAYVINHPGHLKELTGGVMVVFTNDDDPELSELNLESARNKKNHRYMDAPLVEARKSGDKWRLKTLA